MPHGCSTNIMNTGFSAPVLCIRPAGTIEAVYSLRSPPRSPHLTFNFSNPKSVILVLNFLHVRFFCLVFKSITPQRAVNGNFTVMSF
jgi:hypothetical protein